jgi:hypothetical protein
MTLERTARRRKRREEKETKKTSQYTLYLELASTSSAATHKILKHSF